jgi:hypothetical protein
MENYPRIALRTQSMLQRAAQRVQAAGGGPLVVSGAFAVPYTLMRDLRAARVLWVGALYHTIDTLMQRINYTARNLGTQYRGIWTSPDAVMGLLARNWENTLQSYPPMMVAGASRMSDLQVISYGPAMETARLLSAVADRGLGDITTADLSAGEPCIVGLVDVLRRLLADLRQLYDYNTLGMQFDNWVAGRTLLPPSVSAQDMQDLLLHMATDMRTRVYPLASYMNAAAMLGTSAADIIANTDIEFANYEFAGIALGPNTILYSVCDGDDILTCVPASRVPYVRGMQQHSALYPEANLPWDKRIEAFMIGVVQSGMAQHEFDALMHQVSSGPAVRRQRADDDDDESATNDDVEEDPFGDMRDPHNQFGPAAAAAATAERKRGEKAAAAARRRHSKAKRAQRKDDDSDDPFALPYTGGRSAGAWGPYSTPSNSLRRRLPPAGKAGGFLATLASPSSWLDAI